MAARGPNPLPPPPVLPPEQLADLALQLQQLLAQSAQGSIGTNAFSRSDVGGGNAAAAAACTTPPRVEVPEIIPMTDRTNAHYVAYKDGIDAMVADCKTASHVWLTEAQKAEYIQILQDWEETDTNTKVRISIRMLSP